MKITQIYCDLDSYRRILLKMSRQTNKGHLREKNRRKSYHTHPSTIPPYNVFLFASLLPLKSFQNIQKILFFPHYMHRDITIHPLTSHHILKHCLADRKNQITPHKNTRTEVRTTSEKCEKLLYGIQLITWKVRPKVKSQDTSPPQLSTT